MEGLSFRKATAGDTPRIAEIIHGEPSDETIRMTGSLDRARAIGNALVRTGLQGWQRTVLGDQNGDAVVVLQAGDQLGGASITPRLALQALRIFGPIDLFRMLFRLRAQMRVNAPAPSGAYHISELHTRPTYRSRGIGGAALDYAEEQARGNGHKQMSLITTTVNPARRLYERHGYCVVETRTDAAYERYTGIAGRHLMVKELS